MDNRINCCALMKKISMLDFAITETVLYLDAYPECSAALDYYHRLIEQREAYAKEYQAKCGPITNHGVRSCDGWSWVKGPWPWEYDAN